MLTMSVKMTFYQFITASVAPAAKGNLELK